MRRISMIVMGLALVALAACTETWADLTPVKIRSIQLVSAPERKAQTDFLVTTIGGTLLDHGALMDEQGLVIEGEAVWYTTGGVSVIARAIDTKGLSLSVAVEIPNTGLNSLDILSRRVADRFAEQLGEQITGQRLRGRTISSGTQTPQSLPPSPDKTISTFGLDTKPAQMPRPGPK